MSRPALARLGRLPWLLALLVPCLFISAAYDGAADFLGSRVSRGSSGSLPIPGESLCAAPIGPVPLVNPTVITACTETALRAALAAGGHITFDCGPDPVTIPISAPLVTSATADIVLDGKGLITLDGQNTTRIMEKPFTPGSHIDKTLGNDLTIQNLSFVNGRAPTATQHQDGNARGGALWVTSPGTRLHLINTIWRDNRTTSTTDEDNQGGAVYAANIYETVIVGSTFEGNVAGGGGAFGAIASGLLVYNSRFAGNRAVDDTAGGVVRGHGGAVHLDGVTNSFNPDSNHVVTICGSTFTGNTSVRGGGAIKSTVSDGKGTKLTIDRSTFADNRLVGVPDVEGHGGALYHIEDDPAAGSDEDNIEIRDSVFHDNYASRQGGAVWISVRGNGRIVNTTFAGNEASARGSNRVGQGGALIISRGFIDIVHATFAHNFATFQGGAVFAGGESADRAVTLANSLFYDNRLDPTHTNPVTTEWQGYHTNRPLQNGGGNLQYPRAKEPDFDNDVNNLITLPPEAVLFADPLLGPLADNGGPTATAALGAGSPALNAAGSSACPATDQRGVPRPQGSGCDIGAFERVVMLTVTPSVVAAGQGDVALHVYGDGFTPASQVEWDGQPVPTTYVDGQTLQATVAAAAVGPPRLVPVGVDNVALPPATVWVVAALRDSYVPLLLRR